MVRTNSAEDMIESAWGIIANAGSGDWTKESEDWQEAAAAWRDRYHSYLGEVGPPRREEESANG